MFIQTFPSGPLSTNAYIAICSATRHAAIIDPAPDSAEVVSTYLKAHNLKPQAILLTHSHWDHIADVSVVKENFNLPVYVHSQDAPNLENPGADSLPLLFAIPGVKADFFFDELPVFTLGELHFQIIHTPGHSGGSICLFEPTQKVLFSGDTLFKGTIGNISFPTSQPQLVWSSLEKLAQLPPDTKVYPGHGSSTSIGKESWLSDAQSYFG